MAKPFSLKIYPILSHLTLNNLIISKEQKKKSEVISKRMRLGHAYQHHLFRLDTSKSHWKTCVYVCETHSLSFFIALTILITSWTANNQNSIANGNPQYPLFYHLAALKGHFTGSNFYQITSMLWPLKLQD